MVLALLLAGVLWLPQTVAAQAEPAVTILADRLNVRSGPGTNYRVVAGVNGGEDYLIPLRLPGQ